MDRIKEFFIVTVFGAISAWFGVLAIPIVILFTVNIVDWITGIMAAKNRGEEIKSKLLISGVFKKVSQWLLVFIGFLFDCILIFSSSNFSITLPFSYLFASLVCVWLILCEFVSIIENISSIGSYVPPFLIPAIKWLKNNIESKADINESPVTK